MNVEIIVALITATISFIALLIARIVEIRENRKNRYASIITKQTISNMLFTRENFSIILSNTNPILLSSYANKNSEEIKVKLVRACTNIELQFKSAFSMEVDMINVMRELVCLFFNYLSNTNTEQLDLVIAKHFELAELVELYDYADWLYSKDQAWYRKKTQVDFEQIYHQQQKLFEEARKPVTWETNNSKYLLVSKIDKT